jgi:hypothetical protein
MISEQEVEQALRRCGAGRQHGRCRHDGGQNIAGCMGTHSTKHDGVPRSDEQPMS